MIICLFAAIPNESIGPGGRGALGHGWWELTVPLVQGRVYCWTIDGPGCRERASAFSTHTRLICFDSIYTPEMTFSYPTSSVTLEGKTIIIVGFTAVTAITDSLLNHLAGRFDGECRPTRRRSHHCESILGAHCSPRTRVLRSGSWSQGRWPERHHHSSRT